MCYLLYKKQTSYHKKKIAVVVFSWTIYIGIEGFKFWCDCFGGFIRAFFCIDYCLAHLSIAVSSNHPISRSVGRLKNLFHCTLTLLNNKNPSHTSKRRAIVFWAAYKSLYLSLHNCDGVQVRTITVPLISTYITRAVQNPLYAKLVTVVRHTY